MASKRWLISWIGNADHQASEGASATGEGPIATALTHAPKFDRVCLLTNYPHERSAAYCAWLEQHSGYDDAAVDLQEPLSPGALTLGGVLLRHVSDRVAEPHEEQHDEHVT